MVEEFEWLWRWMKFLSVFSFEDLFACPQIAHVMNATKEDGKTITPRLVAGYLELLVLSGYVVELSGKRDALTRMTGRYRLLRVTGQQAPVIRTNIFFLQHGKSVKFDYAMYDPNLDRYFPVVLNREVA